MKKLIALLLALCLLAGLAACGGETGKPDSSNPGVATKDPDSKDTKEPEPQTDAPETELPPESPAFEEMTAISNDACSVTISALENDSFWGYILKAELENKTADKTLRFTVEDASINGVSCDPYFSTELAAGEKSDEDITFSDDDLKDVIGTYTDIEVTLRVYDADDYFSDDIAEETFHIYPYGKEKATRYVREAQPTDRILVDNDSVTVIVTDFDPENIWGYALNLYLVNKTDSKLAFSADDVLVNGMECDPYWATTVAPGKVAFSVMDWMDSAFEEKGISKVEKIEMALRVYFADDLWADDVYQDTITLKP